MVCLALDEAVETAALILLEERLRFLLRRKDDSDHEPKGTAVVIRPLPQLSPRGTVVRFGVIDGLFRDP